MRRIAIALVLLPLFALAAAAASPENPDDGRKYREDMDEGVRLLRSGSRDEISRAIAKFKSALKLRPESAEAYYWIALAYSDQNNYLRAADNAKEATIYDDRMAEAWLLWGQILLYQREWKGALDKLETAARLDAENPITQYNLGRVHYHGFNDPETALPKFRSVWQKTQALNRERPSAESRTLQVQARLYMGYCEFDRKHWDGAINAFRDVLVDAGNHYDAALCLGIAYRRNGLTAESIDILQNLARTIQLDSPAARRILAETYLNLADIYLKDLVHRDEGLALAYLQAFVDGVSEGHAMLEIAKEYLAAVRDRGE